MGKGSRLTLQQRIQFVPSLLSRIILFRPAAQPFVRQQNFPDTSRRFTAFSGKRAQFFLAPAHAATVVSSLTPS